MALAAGTKLGPYEIQEATGAGGMGEVYRARDTRLERTVAVKVLPARLSSDPTLRQRFEREARVISSLSHPHICTLFDIGHQGDTDFLVMEFLEGETLAQRLKKGPLPLEQAVRVAIEIADALDKAHRQGLVHRDLKPGNIMLCKSGAKLLDFGLAKPAPAPLGSPVISGSASASHSPTMSVGALALSTTSEPMTQHGTVMGTFQYMAPEVLQGAEADARSDIFSLGCVLYEMVTGRHAFEGKSNISMLVAILEREPEPVGRLQPPAPPALDYILRTCLAKEPDERFATAHDLMLQLKWVSEARSGAIALPGPLRQRWRAGKRWLPSLAVGGWAAAFIFLIALMAGQNSPPQKLAAELNSPRGAQFASAISGAPALSPDGTKLAFLTLQENQDTEYGILWVRDLRTGKVQKLEAAGDAAFPFWSPDGRQLGFFSGGKMKKVALEGGPVQVLCDAPEGRGGSWSPRGVIIFTPRINDAIYSVSEGGGAPQKLTDAKPGWTHRNPYFLPDGEHFLFIVHDAENMPTGALYAASIRGGAPKLVLDRASNVQYARGHLLYLREGNLVAQPFDPGSLKLSGVPVPVAEKLDYYGPRDLAAFTAAGGALAYRQADILPSQPVLVDASGKELQRLGQPGVYLNVGVSPDGSKLGLVRELDTSHSDLWIVDLKRNTMSRATFAEAPVVGFAFSHDGSRVAVGTGPGAAHDGWIQSVNSSGILEKLPVPAAWTSMSDWSSDGRYLFATVQNNLTREDIYYMDLEGDRQFKPFLQTPRAESGPELSPNGKWLAYVSDESGQPEVYVMAFPGPGGKWQISSDQGSSATWSSDGKQLYFRCGSKLLRAAIQDQDSFQFSSPVELPISLKGVQDFAPDHTPGRFILLQRTGDSASEPMHVVLNWNEGLGR
jgi:serine/threonine protein kinase